MRVGLSTLVFLPQRLHPGLLDAIARSGVTAVEIFAARHHFDYTDRAAVRELAGWFRDHPLQPSLHQPLFPGSHWSRHVAATLNVIDPDKSQRIAAMDEVKRATEAAEHIPFRAITLHLGARGEAWSPRALEHSLTAIEHLKAFAAPLGVQLLLENLQNDVTAPEHLLEILRVGHFETVGVTLDIGHAHLTDYQNPGAGIDAAFELLRPRIGQLHLHDNDGREDQHLWPGSVIADNSGSAGAGGIDWSNAQRHLANLPPETPAFLEIAHELNETADSVTAKARAFLDSQQRQRETVAAAAHPEA